MTTVALSVLESNALHNGSVIIHGLSMFRTYGSRVDGNAVILVVDNSAVNDNVGASTNVNLGLGVGPLLPRPSQYWAP